MAGLAINENKGFQITFDNGVTVSVQFGDGNYCSNGLPSFKYGDYTEGQKCINAEVAIWNAGGWITQKYDPDLTDEVIGHVPPDEIAKIIAWAQAYKGV